MHDGNHAVGRALSAAVHAGVLEARGFLFGIELLGEATKFADEDMEGLSWPGD